MSKPVLRIRDVSKLYRLGQIGTGTLVRDLDRWWHKIRGKQDPYAKIGSRNDRTTSDDNEYVWALRDINLDVGEGDVLGVIGRNGAGKSTLLKLLSRITTPTTGIIQARGRIASLLEIGTGFHPELSGKENIYLNGAILGMRKLEIDHRLDEIVAFSGCERYLDTPVRRYSSGMYVRLAFAVAAHLRAAVLIVDEVLAVGDTEFQKKCIGRMKEVATDEGRSVIFVSHNMAAVANLCSRAIILDSGELQYSGDAEDAIASYLETSNSRTSGFERNISSLASLRFPTFLSVKIRNNLGQEAVQLDFRMSFVVELEYHCPHPVPGLEISIRVFHASAVPVFTSNISDADSGALALERRGTYRATATIPASTLMPGRYFINAALHEPNITMHDFQESVVQFEIAETGSIGAKHGQGALEMGFVHMNINWNESHCL